MIVSSYSDMMMQTWYDTNSGYINFQKNRMGAYQGHNYWNSFKIKFKIINVTIVYKCRQSRERSQQKTLRLHKQHFLYAKNIVCNFYVKEFHIIQ